MRVQQFFRLLAIGSVTIALGSASAQEAEKTFKLNGAEGDIPEGMTFDTEYSMLLKEAKMSMKVIEKMTGTMSMSLKETIASRILGPFKAVSVIRKSDNRVQFTMGGENEDEKVKNPLVDKKIITEKVDGKWQVKLHGEEATGEVKELLETIEEAAVGLEKNTEYTFRNKEFKVGDQIRVQVPLFSVLEGLVDKDITGGGVLKIDRIEDLEGVRCAVLSGSYSEKGHMEKGEEYEEGNAVVNGKITVWRSIDYSMDMKVEYEGTYQMSARLAGLGVVPRR